LKDSIEVSRALEPPAYSICPAILAQLYPPDSWTKGLLRHAKRAGCLSNVPGFDASAPVGNANATSVVYSIDASCSDGAAQ
jgi:hypothetical protein